MTDEPALDTTRRFLHRYWGDQSMAEAVVADLERTLEFGPERLQEGLIALRTVLADPPEDRRLIELVAWDANYPLRPPSAAAARAFLEDAARTVAGVLAAAGPT
jgi:hypothetical protein